MKKTFVCYINGKYTTNYIGQGEEVQTLYAGVHPNLYGNFLVTSGGDPVTLNELEGGEACGAAIDSIQWIMADPTTDWRECNAADQEYVREWLSIWGIN